jgi:hypothetical protein
MLAWCFVYRPEALGLASGVVFIVCVIFCQMMLVASSEVCCIRKILLLLLFFVQTTLALQFQAALHSILFMMFLGFEMFLCRLGFYS